MEKIKKENVKDKIMKFKLCEDDKNKLLFLYDCLVKSKINKNNYNINITIDNMPMVDIKKYMTYIKKVIQYSGFDCTIKNNCLMFQIKEIKNKIILFEIDSDDLTYKIREQSNYLKEIISNVVFNNNILIMTSVKSFDEYESFNNSNILDILPHIAFHGVMNEQVEYKKFINKFRKSDVSCKIKSDEFNKIVQGISDDNYIQNFRISDYLYDYSTKNYFKVKNDIISINTFDKLIDNKNQELDDENQKLPKLSIDQLVGLDNVKDELNKLFNYVEFLKNHNIDRDGTYLNMFFLGNPGTGKTMIANIVADRLYELGFIEKNEVVKVIPTDLIGEYVGQTRRKIRNILEKAKGKILFIDEAYLLYNNNYKSGNNPFMEEAIVELLKYLEDVNNITIFAGYKDKMQKLYEVNPGIKSRIYKEIIFEDYNIAELYEILESNLKEKGFSINKYVNKKFIQEYIEIIKKDKSFGNARTMKQLAQKLIINHATNYANKKVLEELVISRLDIPNDNKKMVREMGFGE